MNITVIGSGDMGSGLVKQLTRAGHRVLVTGRDAAEIARALPGARVVKAFNTVFAQVLDEGARLDGQPVPVFVAGDDPGAKLAVAGIAQSMGFDVIDAGALKNARYLEPLAGLNIYLGYGAKLGTGIAPTWLRKERGALAERAAA